MYSINLNKWHFLINNNDEKFILVSNEVTKPGYREIYSYKDEDVEEEGPVKETFKMGEKLSKCKLEDVKKETKPAKNNKGTTRPKNQTGKQKNKKNK